VNTEFPGMICSEPGFAGKTWFPKTLNNSKLMFVTLIFWPDVVIEREIWRQKCNDHSHVCDSGDSY
jgi:hypothetical protein